MWSRAARDRVRLATGIRAAWHDVRQTHSKRRQGHEPGRDQQQPSRFRFSRGTSITVGSREFGRRCDYRRLGRHPVPGIRYRMDDRRKSAGVGLGRYRRRSSGRCRRWWCCDRHPAAASHAPNRRSHHRISSHRDHGHFGLGRSVTIRHKRKRTIRLGRHRALRGDSHLARHHHRRVHSTGPLAWSVDNRLGDDPRRFAGGTPAHHLGGIRPLAHPQTNAAPPASNHSAGG